MKKEFLFNWIKSFFKWIKNNTSLAVFIVILVVVTSLKKTIALDNFINGPEQIFFPENKWALPLFFETKYPVYGYLYFFVDILFAGAILWLTITLYKKFFRLDNDPERDLKRRFSLYFLLGFYVISDLFEGLFNILLISNYNPEKSNSLIYFLEPIGGAKIVFLLLTVFYMIYLYIKDKEVKKITDHTDGNSTLSRIKRNISEILAGNYVSIFFALLIFYLILKNNQGQVLLLELVHSPWNMIVLFIPLIILLSLMTLINSYYTYFKFYEKNKKTGQQGKYFNWNASVKDDVTQSNSVSKEALTTLKLTRATQGVVKRYLTLTYHLMAAVLFISLAAHKLRGADLRTIGYIISVILVGSIYLYIWVKNKKLKHLEELKRNSKSEKEIAAYHKMDNEFMDSFTFLSYLFGFIAVSAFISYFISSCVDIHGFLLLKIISLAIFFSATAFYLANIILIRRSTRNFRDRISRAIKRTLANDENIIKIQKVIGSIVLIASLVQLVINHTFFYTAIKSVNMILLYVFLGFWLFYLITSSMVFAIQKIKENSKKRKNELILSKMNILILFIFLLIGYSFVFNNSYFTVKTITVSEEKLSNTQNESGISLKSYLKRKITKNHNEFYVIANEGGGLRANYWSLLILDKLANKDPNFYDKVLMTSGASGGSIGQSIFNLMQADSLLKNKQNIIEQIGNTDHLASDLFSLCFRRPIIRLIPFNLSDKDWAKYIRGDIYASRRYAQMAVGEKSWIYNYSTDHSFKEFWNNAYKKTQGAFPLTLINSTHAEYGSEGIGSPLNQAENKVIFNGSTSYLEINEQQQNKSISFLDAAFLANRFPIVSSPAIIPTKGHFIDAGAFDNNGISSILDVLWHVQNLANEDIEWKEIWDSLKGKLKLIVISNGKGTYIKNKYNSLRETKGGKLFPSSNLKGSIGAAVSTSAVKEYIGKEVDSLNSIFKNVIKIDLPYYIKSKRNDIQNTLKVQIQDINLETYIDRENKSILDFLDTPKNNYQYNLYFDPPLGRSLSKPVTDYMKIMADYVMDKESKQIFN